MMKYSTESEILNRLINGQPEAFSHLYCKYQPVMLSYAKKKFSNVQEAEDIIQEIFLSFWQRRNRLSENLPVKYYLLGAIHLKYAQHCRHNSVKNRYLTHLFRSISESTSNNELEGKELGILIKSASSKISAPACRKVFELAFFHEKDCREISEIMNIKPQVVRNQTSRALKVIREHLRKVI